MTETEEDKKSLQITTPAEGMTKPGFRRGGEPLAVPGRGLSHSPGLRFSTDGNHVFGPQQAPADPAAAGLDISEASNEGVPMAHGSGPK